MLVVRTKGEFVAHVLGALTGVAMRWIIVGFLIAVGFNLYGWLLYKVVG